MIWEGLNSFDCCSVVPKLVESLEVSGDVLAHFVKNITAHVFEMPKRLDGRLLTCIVVDCLNGQVQDVSQMFGHSAVECILVQG